MFFPLRATSKYSKQEIISMHFTEKINQKIKLFFFSDYKFLSNILWDSL